MKYNQLATSPCSTPELDLDAYFSLCARTGYRNTEIFTSWVRSAFDYSQDSAPYLEKGREYNLCFTSMHLPVVRAENLRQTLREAVEATRFATKIGAEVVLFKVSDRPTYIKAAKPFLDAIEGWSVTPVIQNHNGSPLTTLEHVQEVYEGINDTRLSTLLEVGHFHSAGVSWQRAADYLGSSIALVHIKDRKGGVCVPLGTGEIDLKGLFAWLDEGSYLGRVVVEMEVSDKENTEKYLKDALAYLKPLCEED